MRLLDRSPRGMQPTVFGTALHRHARAVIGELAAAQGELQELRGAAKGVVRVGAQPSLAGTLLARAIAALQARRPGVKVAAQVGTTDLLDRLRRGDLDLLLATLAPELADAELVEEFLYDDGIVLVAGAGSPLAGDSPPDPERLRAASWALPRPPDPLRLRFEQAFARRGEDPPAVAVETGSEALIRACVERHGHASLLPLSLVEEALAAGRMRRIAAPDFALARRSGVLRRPAAPPPPAAQALLEALRAEARP